MNGKYKVIYEFRAYRIEDDPASDNYGWEKSSRVIRKGEVFEYVGAAEMGIGNDIRLEKEDGSFIEINNGMLTKYFKEVEE